MLKASRHLIWLFLLAVVAIVAIAPHIFWASVPPTYYEPLFDGLGTYRRTIRTSSAVAQRYFDQGLAFLYGFDKDAARRSFDAAARSDPKCAMAFWGIAMANGPDINNFAVSPAQAKAAWNAAGKARELSANVGPADRALINAVAKRHAPGGLGNRQQLDKAYADAMEEAARMFPADPDVGALAAESLLDLHPWDQWSLDGKPRPGTEEAIRILNSVLRICPEHPFALHLSIHALEDSAHPERADAAADRLRDLAPRIEHLLHVPSHIDILRGRWQAAVVANQKAIAADEAYRRMVPVDEVHRIWVTHDYHMLAYAALMQGERAEATQSMIEMKSIVSETSPDYVRTVDILLAMPYEVNLRFGRWEEMLSEPKPDKRFGLATALWHYARAIALAARNEVKAARFEQQEFLAAQRALFDTPVLSRDLGSEVLPVAQKMVQGEILYREGKPDDAIAALREAIRLEDALPAYREPPIWMVPVRHALGAILTSTGRFKEAEVAYREDLKRHPENGWSLYGLAQSLKMQGKKAEAAAVRARFERAWQYADFKISSSCCCLPGK
jgi:tetratricopeptide (TPR) repeat protein